MSIKNNFFAPWAKGLGATRRAAMLLLVMMLTTTTAWADDSGYCGTYVTYSYSELSHTLTIRGTGAMYDYNNLSGRPWNSYADEIRTVVIENRVTSIGALAFSSTGLTSIEIPASVTSIGECAFLDCQYLTSITFAKGSQLESIGRSAFSSSRLTSIEIPAGVTSIGESAFSECTNLGSVTFAEGSQLESIGDNAFRLCSNLTSITIPASVTSIGSYAFQDCDLASMAVADGNTVFDSRNGCNAIIETLTNKLIIGCKNSTIPASVTSIGESAFQNCRNLTSITIPAGVTSIGGRAFQSCFYLATVTVYAPSCSLGENAFANCGNLTNIYVFSDLVDDYQAAWSDYTSIITGITGGYCGTTDHERDVVWVLTGESTNYTLTISGTGAMADYASSYDQPWEDYRSSIKTVVIGNGVTSIGNYTFAYCTGLTSIEIPASVTSIGDDAFWNCSNLATFTFAEDSQLATIGISAFSSCSGLTSVEIPAGVTSIGNHAFKKCSNLATVTFAEDSQLTSIGEYAFCATGLTSIEIPASVTSIGDHAFDTCTGLATVSFAAGSQLTSIGKYAFDNTGLTSIEIPASVTSIGVNAFRTCSNLTTMTVEAGNAVYDSRNGCNAIIEKSSNTLIAGCKNTTIPANVTSIGSYAFQECSGLTSIEIPASVTSIGISAFQGCSGLTSIDIPAGVTSIGRSAFEGCSGLTSIEIPAGVTSIGGTAFKNCSNLATVTVYAPSCSLGEDAFYKCTKLTKIYVFSDLVEDYQAAKNWSSYEDIITAIEGIALADNADNSSLITAANCSFLNVTLQGRTLYKDGDWNTLCLPFALASLTGTPLEGATVMELDTEGTYDTDKQTGYDSESGTLSLYFKNATAIEGGKPYLVKWESGSNITDPVFYGVTVSNEDPENRKVVSNDEKVTFRGNYSPVALTGGDASNLYLGAANKLYWPSADCTINAFRGYFHVDLSNGAKVREIRLSLDDNVTSIQNAEFIIHNYNGGATYNLSGQKVSDDNKGIVIKNGRKYLK